MEISKALERMMVESEDHFKDAETAKMLETARELLSTTEIETDTTTEITLILLLHQISAELITNLTKKTVLCMQAKLYPNLYQPKIKYEKITFDKNLKHLKYWCMNFDHKEDFVSRATNINSIRNKVAHYVMNPSVNVKSEFNRFKVDYLEMIEEYEKCHKTLKSLTSEAFEKIRLEVR